ncbi:hypothetical protein BRAS3809_7470009 [Bradyrhizobium sp. STM 3809]|nr:hypothetical protein BRAS3809_7470009 [Bradyrhizobium sp. STM 3809]
MLPRFAPRNDGLSGTKSLKQRYSAACCATVGSVPATVARRMSRGWD